MELDLIGRAVRLGLLRHQANQVDAITGGAGEGADWLCAAAGLANAATSKRPQTARW